MIADDHFKSFSGVYVGTYGLTYSLYHSEGFITTPWSIKTLMMHLQPLVVIPEVIQMAVAVVTFIHSKYCTQLQSPHIYFIA